MLSLISVLLVVSLSAWFSACGKPAFDIYSQSGRDAIIDEVNFALTRGQCDYALGLISPLYHSPYSDNKVRLATASVYGCFANVNVFNMSDTILQNAGALGSNQIWQLFTEMMYPSTPGDSRFEGGTFAMDAAMSVLEPSFLIPVANLVLNDPNTPSDLYNKRSIVITDHTIDGNLYLSYVAMATVGIIQNQYGNPNVGTYTKGNDLPWITAVTMDSTGCAYAAAVLNMVEAMDQVAPTLNSSFGTNLATITSTFKTQIYAACDVGCQNTDPAGAWVASGCTVTTACATCPTRLRDRYSCTGVVTDQNSCAAAGIVNFVNYSVLGWQ